MKNGGGESRFKGWRNYLIAAGLLMAFAFFINRGIKIKGLYMDDLYLWSCFEDQSFLEYVFPMGSTRFRFIYYLASYLELLLVGTHVHWLGLINILANGAVAVTLFCMGKRLGRSWPAGILCGLMYLVSRMAYYQIGQVYGLMETMALWMAILILYWLYLWLNAESGRLRYYYGAIAMYVGVCFVHERFMALFPLFFLVLGMKKWKRLIEWPAPVLAFAAVMVTRFFTIGSLSPAGTGGTNVVEEFSFMGAVKYAAAQVAYVFGINTGPEMFNGMSWSNSPKLIRYMILGADAVLLVLVILFVVKIITGKGRRFEYIRNFLLFVTFVFLCIVCSSVTVRLEMRWVYVSMAASLLLIAYICGTIAGEPGKKALIWSGVFLLYAAAMFPAEAFYRTQYVNLYLWPDQTRYNSLAEETYGRYGDDLFGKTIYIMGNSYEMSDFTAETFFKVYDKKKEAAGTGVVFINDIRDIGQVTDGMLVFREDPAHNGYQDVTDFVRNLKCQIVTGYYRDGWMDEDAAIRVMAGPSGLIQMQFSYPAELVGGEQTIIAVNGAAQQAVDYTERTVTAQVQVAPYETVDLAFHNTFFVPNPQEQRGETRLSVLMNLTTD